VARQLVIGVDSSTTSCKVIAWDRRGRAVAEGRAAYPTNNPRSGWYEQDAELWWSSFCRATTELFRAVSPGRIEALSISNQRESIVAVDRDGSPLRPAILWLDERSAEQLGRLDRIVGRDRLHRISGKPLCMLPSLPKLLWMAENEAEIFSRAACFLEPHAFLVQRLIGRRLTSLACADPTGLVDMRAGRWSKELLRVLGLNEDRLPELKPPGEILGVVSGSAAAQSGLPAGLPVVAGAGDGQCSGLGAGVTGPQTAYLNMGTGVIGGFYSAEYRIDPAFRTLYAPFAGSYYLETVIQGGVFTVAWFVNKFASELDKPWLPASVEQLLEQGAADVPAGAEGLLLIPYWLSALNPYWDPDATGVMIGWRGDHGPQHFYRAILEGIAYEQRLATERVLTAGVADFEEFRVVGGGSRSELWCRIMADTTGRPLALCSHSEASALGAGMLAATAAGWYENGRKAAEAMSASGLRYLPDRQNQKFYQRIYTEVYRKLFPATRRLVDRLSEITRESKNESAVRAGESEDSNTKLGENKE